MKKNGNIPPRRNPSDTQIAGQMRGVITDDIVQAQRERNEARRQEAVARMGQSHLLHPSNQVQRKTK